MNKCEFLFLLNCISSDFIANIIAFISLVITIVALVIGGKKVSEALEEYRKKKRAAVFSYHMNMKIFIMRLKRLVTNSEGEPIKSLYLFSSEEEIRQNGYGYEGMAERLVDLSKKLLDYLSTESDQIPASSTDADLEIWDNLIDKLVDFLSDFLLYNTDCYLAGFDYEEGIKEYHKEFIEVLDGMIDLISQSKIHLIKEVIS